MRPMPSETILMKKAVLRTPRNAKPPYTQVAPPAAPGAPPAADRASARAKPRLSRAPPGARPPKLRSLYAKSRAGRRTAKEARRSEPFAAIFRPAPCAPRADSRLVAPVAARRESSAQGGVDAVAEPQRTARACQRARTAENFSSRERVKEPDGSGAAAPVDARVGGADAVRLRGRCRRYARLEAAEVGGHRRGAHRPEGAQGCPTAHALDQRLAQAPRRRWRVRISTSEQPRACSCPSLQVFGLKLACAGVAGVIGASAVFPLDMVKTRLQNQKVGPNGERMYAPPRRLPSHAILIECALTLCVLRSCAQVHGHRALREDDHQNGRHRRPLHG